MGKFKIDCVQNLLENCFEKYGRFVAKFPLPFVLVPALVACLLSLGMINFTKESDVEYLYTPTNGPAKDERRIIESLFPENQSEAFSPIRKTNWDGFFKVIITNKNSGGNLYDVNSIAAILSLDSELKQLSDANSNRYEDVCAVSDNLCYEDEFIGLLNGTAETIITEDITYPTYRTQFLGLQLGGVTVDSNEVSKKLCNDIYSNFHNIIFIIYFLIIYGG